MTGRQISQFLTESARTVPAASSTENEMKFILTDGFHDFGLWNTEEEAIDDAIENAYVTREQIQNGIQKYKDSNILGKGLYFDELSDEDAVDRV